MKLRLLSTSLLASLFFAPLSSAFAERGTYGSVTLTGLARESWPYNDAGPQNAMVCNVNGPEGFLTVRSCANSNCPEVRSLKRLAVLVVNTEHRAGRWVWVSTAYRTHTEWGQRQRYQPLPVEGWVHDGYLCDFLD